jgi:putative hydrolase of the HAD superfamily
MKYKAVIFDLFGTLVDNFSFQEHRDMLSDMAEALSVPSQQFIDHWIETFNDRVTGKFSTPESNIVFICKKVGLDCGEEQIKRAIEIRREFTRGSLTPRRDAIATISKLRIKGCKIALVTDCTYEVPHLWITTPFANLIDVPIFSCKAGIKKPDPRIYQMALDGLGCAAAECLYVGDGSSQELTGAQKVGMHPVLIKVPYEDETAYKVNPEDWKGTRVSALKEILDIMK